MSKKKDNNNETYDLPLTWDPEMGAYAADISKVPKKVRDLLLKTCGHTYKVERHKDGTCSINFNKPVKF